MIRTGGLVPAYIGKGLLSPQSQDNNEYRPHAYHEYHRIEIQDDRTTTMVPTMATMATTNAAATGLDSKWTPRRHFHTSL